MVEPGPGLPSHIALLLNEEFDLSDPRLVARKLRSMVRELKDQAEVGSFVPLPGLSEGESEFRAVLSGGLDLFASHGACQAHACRMGYADQIARTVALMADRVTAHDYFFESIHDLRSRPTNEELSRLVSDVAVLHRIRPLIEMGLLRFTSPSMPLCRSCLAEFAERVQSLGDQAVARFGDQLSVERSEEGGHIGLSALYDPPLHIHFPASFLSPRSDDEIKAYFIHQAVRSTLWDARSAAWVSGSVFSNSPVGISALLSAEGVGLSPPELRLFAAERTANLPWVAGLTIEQTLDLRDAASQALPRLREFMARRLSGTGEAGRGLSWIDTVSELREQAEEVRSELELATTRSRPLARNAVGILGLAVSAACLVTDGPGSALGGLIGTLGLVHGMSGGTQHHLAELQTRPGYVLVAARDILEHARPA